MLFAKYSLREMKCAALFILWASICFTQAFYYVLQLHIELCLLTHQNSKCRCSPACDITYTNKNKCQNHSLSKPRDWSKLCACVRVDVVSGRCSCCFLHFSTILCTALLLGSDPALYCFVFYYELCFVILYTYILLRSVMLQGSRCAFYEGFFRLKFWLSQRSPVVSRGASVFAN